jgi:glutamate-1-semialdehyde aminotransferase
MTVVSATSVIRSALNNRADVALSALEARTCHSWKMNLDRIGVLPRSEDYIGHPSFHLYLREGAGARAVDLDGNCFIDLSMGFGSQLLGHGVQSVQDAVAAQAARGWHFGLANDRELDLARHIQAANAANERVVFCNSGCDAVAYALRAARAFTGRDLVAGFAGSSHGEPDDTLAGENAPRAGLAESVGLFARPRHRKSHHHAGVPQAVADTTVSLTYGHPSAFDQIRRRRRDLAAVIVEPVRALDPNLDHAEWLRELAGACGENGILFILDERLTGFRLAFGGAQERLGLMADLVAYGETVGGGLPLGAVAGRADVIGHLAGREAHARRSAERGMSANMLSVAAGAATLEHLITRRATLYLALDEKSRLLAEAFNAFAEANALPARMRLAGSIFRILFQRADCADAGRSGHAAAEAAFYALALSRGVLVHASRLGFLSAAHTVADIDQVVSAFQNALADVKNDGLFDPTA